MALPVDVNTVVVTGTYAIYICVATNLWKYIPLSSF